MLTVTWLADCNALHSNDIIRYASHDLRTRDRSSTTPLYVPSHDNNNNNNNQYQHHYYSVLSIYIYSITHINMIIHVYRWRTYSIHYCVYLYTWKPFTLAHSFTPNKCLPIELQLAERARGVCLYTFARSDTLLGGRWWGISVDMRKITFPSLLFRSPLSRAYRESTCSWPPQEEVCAETIHCTYYSILLYHASIDSLLFFSLWQLWY